MGWRRRNIRFSFGIAALVTLALLVFRLAIVGDYLQSVPGIQIFLIGALVGGALGGLVPGVLATLLSVVVSVYFVIPPRFSFALARFEDVIIVAFLTTVGFVASALFEVLHTQKERIGKLNADMTARLQELEALHEIFPAPVFFGNADCSVVTANRFGYDLLGMPQGSNVSLTTARVPFRAEQDGAPLAANELPMQKAAATGEPVWGYEHDFVYEDGHVVTLQANARPFFDKDGKVRGVIGAYADLTFRKKAEAEIRRSEERLSRALASSRMAVIDWDLESGIASRSPNVEQIFGVPLPEHSPAEDAFRFMHPEDAPRAREAIRRSVDEGDPVRVDYRFVRSDGTSTWAELRGRVIREGEGRPKRISAVIADINERKAFEQALADSDRKKDEFLALLSHELRNPLAPIRNGVEVLKRVPDGPDRSRALGLLERQVAHLMRLVDDLLDTERIRTGKLRLERRGADLGEIVAGAVSAMQSVAAARDITLASTRPAEPLLVHGDPGRLTQVILNLVDNALKFTPEGGKVRVEARSDGDEAFVRVEDDGIGIPAAKLESIFERFVQVDAAIDRAQGGLGLGLTLVRSLVALHGGCVTAESGGPGRGSAFSIRLPVAPGTVVIHPPKPPAAGTAAGVRVLVIDDTEDASDSLAMFLGLLGYDVRTAPDGPTALAIIGHDPPDVVLCDVAMPGMNGLEVAREIRRRYADRAPRLAALTGYGTAKDREATREAGFEEHFVKPLDVTALETYLAKVVAGARLHEDARTVPFS